MANGVDDDDIFLVAKKAVVKRLLTEMTFLWFYEDIIDVLCTFTICVMI